MCTLNLLCCSPVFSLPSVFSLFVSPSLFWVLKGTRTQNEMKLKCLFIYGSYPSLYLNVVLCMGSHRYWEITIQCMPVACFMLIYGAYPSLCLKVVLCMGCHRYCEKTIEYMLVAFFMAILCSHLGGLWVSRLSHTVVW